MIRMRYLPEHWPPVPKKYIRWQIRIMGIVSAVFLIHSGITGKSAGRFDLAHSALLRGSKISVQKLHFPGVKIVISPHYFYFAPVSHLFQNSTFGFDNGNGMYYIFYCHMFNKTFILGSFLTLLFL